MKDRGLLMMFISAFFIAIPLALDEPTAFTSFLFLGGIALLIVGYITLEMERESCHQYHHQLKGALLDDSRRK